MQKDIFTEINFRLSQDTKLALVTDKGVFLPTQTTSLLIQAVATSISGQHTVLDLGCGTGVVGLSLYLQGLVRPPIFAMNLLPVAVVEFSGIEGAVDFCIASNHSKALLQLNTAFTGQFPKKRKVFHQLEGKRPFLAGYLFNGSKRIRSLF